MDKAEFKNLANPDETRTLGQGTMEFFKLGGGTLGRMTLQPGWRWSRDVKPTVNTEWCEAQHLLFILSGRQHVLMEDGSEFELKAGDFAFIPPRHDAWVVGNEPVVVLDWAGPAYFAQMALPKAA